VRAGEPFANFPWEAHHTIKVWPSRLRVGHEADNLILEEEEEEEEEEEKCVEKPKREAKAKLKGWIAAEEKRFGDHCCLHLQGEILCSGVFRYKKSRPIGI
jgi:hypothetical protein